MFCWPFEVKKKKAFLNQKASAQSCQSPSVRFSAEKETQTDFQSHAETNSPRHISLQHFKNRCPLTQPETDQSTRHTTPRGAARTAHHATHATPARHAPRTHAHTHTRTHTHTHTQPPTKTRLNFNHPAEGQISTLQTRENHERNAWWIVL